MLVFCPHCEVHLKTEGEQKNHLFSISHVKNILGSEYAGRELSGVVHPLLALVVSLDLMYHLQVLKCGITEPCHFCRYQCCCFHK